MMTEYIEGKEEGPVVALVRLTLKVKELVKVMLAAINLK